MIYFYRLSLNIVLFYNNHNNLNFCKEVPKGNTKPLGTSFASQLTRQPDNATPSPPQRGVSRTSCIISRSPPERNTAPHRPQDRGSNGG